MRTNAKHPLVERITHGDVTTDGFEVQLPLTEESGRLVVGAAIHRDDAPHVFDDLTALQDARSAERIEGPMYRLKRLDPASDDAP